MQLTHQENQICKFIGVDRILYQTQDDLVEAITRRGDHHIVRPCMACMDGVYVCGKMDEEKVALLSSRRINQQQ